MQTRGGERLGCCSAHRRLQRCGARSTLASFNQGIQGTKFSFILGHRKPQQASWTGENHRSIKGSQTGLWCNCTKHDSKHSQGLSCGSRNFQQCQAHLDAILRMWPLLHNPYPLQSKRVQDCSCQTTKKHIMSDGKDDLEKKVPST